MSEWWGGLNFSLQVFYGIGLLATLILIIQLILTLLGADGDRQEHRRGLISMIAAWAIDHPEEAARHPEVFPGYVERLQTAAFAGYSVQGGLYGPL